MQACELTLEKGENLKQLIHPIDHLELHKMSVIRGKNLPPVDTTVR